MTNSKDYFAQALLIRTFEEHLLTLFSQGKLSGTVHTCIGQEFSGVALAAALQAGDIIFSNHRCHGHYLARTGNIDGLMAEIMGKAGGICGGRGGSQHICDQRVFSNGIQGGIVPIAAGMALAEKLRNSSCIAVAFIGDGTLGQGAVYETLNLAALWDIPLLIVLENNGISQSTLQHQNLAGPICARAQAFGIYSAQASTWEVDALVNIAEQCCTYTRTHQKPAFLCIDTYRLKAHSKSDDTRAADEIATFSARDPLTLYQQTHPHEAQQALEAAHLLVSTAVKNAEAQPFPSTDSDLQFADATALSAWTPLTVDSAGTRIGEMIHSALGDALAQDERIFLYGEDIEGPYGGAFKITRDLSQRFPSRVRNTPISEAALIGIGNGLALNGMRPLCEIMFGDFLALGFDQFLNHGAKFRSMYNNQVQLPFIIRTPMGGRRGYGATHSQSIEKHFLGIPGTRVIALNSLYSPRELYQKILATLDCPTLVIENKLLYTRKLGEGIPQGFGCEQTDEAIPTLRVCPASGQAEVSLVCYGGMVEHALAALDVLFEEHDILAELLIPQQLYPLHSSAISSAVAITGRLVVIEEGQSFAGLGSELIAQCSQTLGSQLSAVGRVCAHEAALPACAVLENQMLPDASRIVDTVLRICHEQ